MKAPRLIALDLDDTLLNSDKRMTDETRRVLTLAAERGIEIVPCTGRLFGAMPESVRNLPFVHYAIICNGNQVLDLRKQTCVYRADIDWQTALAVVEYLDSLDVANGCYIDGKGVIRKKYYEKLGELAPTKATEQLLYAIYTPVDSVADLLRQEEKAVQKMLIYMPLNVDREGIRRNVAERFPELQVTSSLPYNGEINAADATKGKGLETLAAYLQIPIEEIMAFGDGTNDRTMIEAAGTGVAMGNAVQSLKDAADVVIGCADDNGVAEYLKEILRL